MPSYKAIINNFAPTKGTCQVFAPERPIYFRFELSPALPLFTVTHATCVFENDEQLTGRHQFTGRIGPTEYTMTLDNGVVCSGTLDAEDNVSYEIVGSGLWLDY
jgi:hypothetical protein